MKFRFVKRSKAEETFRVSSIMGKYDLSSSDIVEKFEGEIPFEQLDPWNIGVIYGNSGTGKSQIARNLFKEQYTSGYDYSAASVIDDFPSELTGENIAEIFNSVSFTTSKSWLKPYHVLSNGEKMRVDLARAIADNKSMIVFDEFTSVVDRNVAKVGSFAIQKAIRRAKRKFVAVSCHSDIIDWLEPDWVFCTDSMEYTITRGELRRPKVEIQICQVKGFWDLFKKYHYMNHNLMAGSDQFVAFHNGVPVAFCAIVHLFHNTIKRGKRMHRLVVLPDYQGIGIGIKLFNFVAELYKRENFRVFACFAHPALVRALDRNASWKLIRNVARVAAHAGTQRVSLNRSGACHRLTTGWEYVGE